MGSITLMAKNDFKAFATDRNANVISQEEWEALPALLSGFTAGKASSAQVNKVIRQASFIAAALAQFVSDKTQRDVLDNGDLPGFVELLGSGFAVEYLSRKNPFGDIKSDGTVKTALENLGLGDGSGRLIQCQVFKSSGTYTPTKGTRFIIVEIVGGGGAGGGCQVGYPNNAACGGGGMSGEYVKARVDNPTVTTVTIGYGGTGASASVGAPGGATSFGNTIIAKGGLGGNVLAEGTAPGVVGPYGAYTEPGFTGANIIGSGSGYSSPGVRYSGSLAMGGPGGDSILGAGAGSQAIVGEGINANGHGGGGGGACVYGGATQQRAGGSGMAGIAIIWEYA
ncbi:carbohydrate kinase [Escherichia coli]|nr:carbohydrate kinase [Escherichia coli]NLS31997.1 carbohydrate kinase [Escherichia coli]HBL0512878.1 carbohydrate kinase [Escherichia coli]HBM9643461.1 carbohydrate kinase [Escherichia coli]HDK8914611.1 carbohydrate kinase [Escherichia coli]